MTSEYLSSRSRIFSEMKLGVKSVTSEGEAGRGQSCRGSLSSSRPLGGGYWGVPQAPLTPPWASSPQGWHLHLLEGEQRGPHAMG